MGSPTIFSGNFVKLMKTQLNLKDQTYILTGSTDPSSTPTNAPVGSIYLYGSGTTAKIFVKQDSGSTTNWTPVSASLLSEINIALRDQLVDSPYQLLTEYIAAEGLGGYTAVGATYDSATGTVDFAADGQTLESTNLIDIGQFASQGVDIGSVDLSLFWNKTGSFSTPTTAIFTGNSASVTSGSATVTVTIPNHGLTNGKRVYVQTSAAIGGIIYTDLSANSAVITVIDSNTISYAAASLAASSTSGTIDFVISGFVYLASRDSGHTFFPVSMSQVGTTNVFTGSLEWGTSSTTEPSGNADGAVLETISGGAITPFIINGATQTKLSQTFTVPANANWVINQVSVNVNAVTGTPAGNLYAAIYASSGGLPTGNPVAISTALPSSSVAAGSIYFNLPSPFLAGGTSGTTYTFVIYADSAYYATGNTNNFTFQAQTPGSGAGSFNGTSWSTAGYGLVNVLYGRNQDLRVKILSASGTSLSYPCGLDGFGLFYNLQDIGNVSGIKKTQRFSFNSVTDNLNSFSLNFSPDPDLITCYWIEGGQAFKVPAFTLQGNAAVFPVNSFNQAGVSQTITLVFDQNNGGSYDTNDSNARLMSTNHLGSSSSADDRSQAGRGVQLRDVGGTLREVSLDASGYPQVLTSPGGSVLHSVAPATNTVAGLVRDLKQYVVGTAYTNGTPTITCAQAGFAVTHGVLIPYQTIDGAWRLKFNVAVSFTSASISAISMTLSGATFKTATDQAITGFQEGGAQTFLRCFAIHATGTFSIDLPSAATFSAVMLSGDIELDSKPTWAD